ncbi:MAG: hypothetical protein J0M08_08195 [Bacteroidetes bacterium]|nr:hypothetical protein [Bacteroidota bacterium]
MNRSIKALSRTFFLNALDFRSLERRLLLFVLCCSVFMKWILINYGIPYKIHVDEMAILTDPFKILLMYAEGNFSTPTNILNWLYLIWYAIVFAIGLIFNQWDNFAEFKLFMISENSSFLLSGRMFSLLISTFGSLVLTKLIFKITPAAIFRIIFSLIVVFNPIEINANNWVKFDPLAYLSYALILHTAHRYFIENNHEKRKLLYTFLILALAVRIETIGFLIGCFLFDIFCFRGEISKLEKLKHALPTIIKSFLFYAILTLLPFVLLYKYLHPVALGLTNSETFEQAIVSKLIKQSGSVITNILNSSYYLQALFALLGPVLIIVFFINARKKKLGFVYFSFFVLALVLTLFFVKHTHYLLGVSVLIIYSALIFISGIRSYRVRYLCSMFTLIWMVSYDASLLYQVLSVGDVRVQVKDYLMKNTTSNDYIFVEGVFSQIKDSPERYGLRSIASKELGGGTGLSTELLSKTLKKEDTRNIIEVSDYDYYKGSKYEGVFTNKHDTNQFKLLKPKYFLFEGGDYWDYKMEKKLNNNIHQDFYKFILSYYVLDKSFLYDINDPRLKYKNHYYFIPFLVYKLK